MSADRSALNLALNGALAAAGHVFLVPLAAIRPDAPATVDFCGSLDAAVTALQRLGLDWMKDPGDTSPLPPRPKLYVIRRGAFLRGITVWADDDSPGALATALVGAAVRLLHGEEEDLDGL